ncbi:MAG: DUF427 domain-containing protein [Chitinophagaceae bacterium]|nr:DUF427 domain-containing protein [Rubrivivax sp.]
MSYASLRTILCAIANIPFNPSDLPDWLRAARAQWRWAGQTRPPFAATPGPGQVSVWDFPRPPRLLPDTREVVVRWGTLEVARTRRAVRVLETAHPPSVYLPWADVSRHLLQPAPGGSFCEWKGPAHYWSLVDGARTLPGVAWSYPQPLAGAEMLADCVAFYPARLDCTVDGAAVRAQPGGFYGGWITPDLAGPFKGELGSEGW